MSELELTVDHLVGILMEKLVLMLLQKIFWNSLDLLMAYFKALEGKEGE